MRTPPTVPPNKYTAHTRLAECEVVAANALTAAKEALAQLKLQPPQGPKGETGEKGDRGKDAVCICKNGRDGKDSTVAGPVGPQGRPGKDCVCKTEIAEQRLSHVESFSAQSHAELGLLRQTVLELQATVNALLDQNKRGAEYVAFLQAKVRSKQ